MAPWQFGFGSGAKQFEQSPPLKILQVSMEFCRGLVRPPLCPLQEKGLLSERGAYNKHKHFCLAGRCSGQTGTVPGTNETLRGARAGAFLLH